MNILIYILLFYCCFDSKLWIAVFYPFIEAAIGTKQCDEIFAQSQLVNNKVIKESVYDQVLKLKFEQRINGKKDMVLNHMKGISIFNGLLCSVYEEIGTQMNDEKISVGNNNDPFDLTMRIGLKLKQTITNIKSQLMIQEMIGTNIDMNLDKEKNENSELDDHDDWDNQERKDDWSINNNTYDTDNNRNNNFHIKVPSF